MRLARRASPAAGRDRALQLAGALGERARHLLEVVSDVDVVLAPTSFAAQRAIDWGVAQGKVRRLPLGVLRAAARARPGGVRRRLAYMGTLLPHKGAHVLVEAVRGLRPLDWTLDVCGDPGGDPAYARLLRGLAGDDARIRFRGLVTGDAQDRLWESIDLVALPSLWWENSPLAILEALGRGIAVVASRTGGVPEIVPEGAGLLVEPGAVGAWRQALTDVLEGRALAAAQPPLQVKTAREGAEELACLYSDLAVARRTTQAGAGA
jgi:glycosyltransferase involved in cell wall biosynthesis